MIPHDSLRNRYEARGILRLETALHVGSGIASATTDAEVVRDFLGQPIIPGSSLKGALRSAVERRAEWLNLTACKLEPGNKMCLTTNQVPDAPTPVAKELAPDNEGRRWREQPLEWRLRQMEKNLCHVCQTFGSTVFGGKIQVDDLPLLSELASIADTLIEIRDGVGIDRDSGTAVDGIQFDYQVVPAVAMFRFYLTAENLDPASLALLSLGLLEMSNGAVSLGGKTTRGLGRVNLLLDDLRYFNFADPDEAARNAALMDYLQGQGENHQVGDPREFLSRQVRQFLEGQNAQASAE
ncbi:MAG: CRISPR-associated RAMP protein Csx7 [Dehalococcoidia bacterium]